MMGDSFFFVASNQQESNVDDCRKEHRCKNGVGGGGGLGDET